MAPTSTAARDVSWDLAVWHPTVFFLVGLVVGGLLVAWGHRARLQALRERLRWTDQRLQHVEAEGAAAQQLRIELAQERSRQDADAEKLAWIHTADEQMRLNFRDLADEFLRRSTSDLSQHSQQQLQNLVTPLNAQLSGLDQQVRSLEKERQGAYSGLMRELDLLRTSQEDLRQSAQALRETLRAPGRRGRWGEIQLRRLVEIAGMIDRVDFEEQPTLSDGQRPDLIVHLPGGRSLPVDAKTPMNAFLAAQEEQDPERRRRLLDEHLKATKQRVAELAAKSYWRNVPGSPDFVIMFLANESVLSAAFERQPDFLDQCMAQKVLPATPITLLALMRSIAWGWRQHAVAEDAARIAETGRELHDRLQTFVGHLSQVGKSLDQAVRSFNRSVGSFERRLLPTARRLEETAATDGILQAPDTLDGRPRVPVSSSETD